MSEASSVTGLDADGQAQVLATCNTLTTALCKLPDTGIESLVFKREGGGAMRGVDKIGALSALQDKDAIDLKLHFRGTITPTSNLDFYTSEAAAVFENVASTPSANGTVNLSLVVTKDTMAARAWEDNRFCPALLVKQLKNDSDVTKPKKGKGKGKSKAAAAHNSSVLALTLEESVQKIEGVDMKAFALVGVVPPYEDIRVSLCHSMYLIQHMYIVMHNVIHTYIACTQLRTTSPAKHRSRSTASSASQRLHLNARQIPATRPMQRR